MYTISPNETLIETKTCRFCSVSFPITDKDFDFLNRLAPSTGGQKISLGIPTACPACRRIHQLAWRNEKKIYKRQCDWSQKEIIAMYSPEVPFKVYEEKIWNSDVWDAQSYGRDFDFSRPFFEQFGELMQEIPRPAMARSEPMENSDYSNNCGNLKDTYLCFSARGDEKCYYSIDIWNSNSYMDCYCVYGSEFCYNSVLVYDSYHIFDSYDVKNSQNSRFLLSCENCSDCYGCYGLVNQKYHIYNEPYAPEAYKKELEKLISLPITEQKKRFYDFWYGKYVKKPLKNTGSERVTESSNVVESKNVSFGSNVHNSEDVRYAGILKTSNLVMDCYLFGNHIEKIYSSHQVGNNSHSLYFSALCYDNVSNIFYSYFCLRGVHDCFGCVGFRSGESYCILNKQYTREEYDELVPRIIEHMRKTGEWGEFFPANLSPHGYNESTAHIGNPLTREAALTQGFNWSDYETPFPKVDKIIPASKLPDNITQIPNDILNWAIECEVSGKPYRIIKPELDYYRKLNISIPKKHPDERQKDRLEWHMNY